MQTKIKVIFLGTSRFAVPILEALIKESGFNVAAVIANPNKPTGRKKELTSPPVKILAQKYNIPALQPDKLKNNKEFFAEFQKLNPDVCVVAAYGKIIPEEYLTIPRFGFLNLHPSLLPKYRGPSPIQTALLGGEKETGVTIIKMDKEIDHGPILASAAYEAPEIKYYEEIEKDLSKLGAELLVETLPKYTAGKIKPKPQNHSRATFTKKFKAEDGRIDWNSPAEKIYNLIRALNPEPGAWTVISGQNKNLKILKAGLTDQLSPDKPGVGLIKNKAIFVSTRDKIIRLDRVQLAGKKPMLVGDFVNGLRNSKIILFAGG